MLQLQAVGVEGEILGQVEVPAVSYMQMDWQLQVVKFIQLL
jgi:hypothetical protein